MAQREVSIVKDYWDWQSERVQVTTGMFVLTVSMLLIWLLSDNNVASSISHQFGNALISIYDAKQATLLHEELSKFSLTFLTIPRLLLHITTSVFVGLIALEISKIYGNRWGMVHSVWTALLYMVCPTVVMLLYAGDGLFILLGAFFATLAIYSELRFRYLNEDFYLVSSVVFVALSLSMDFVSGLTGLIGIILSRLLLSKVRLKSFSRKLGYSYLALLIPALLIVMQKGGLRDGHFSLEQTSSLLTFIAKSPEHLIAYTKTSILVLTITLALVGFVTVLRILIGTIWLRPLLFLSFWVSLCFFVASFYIGGEHYIADSSVIVSSLVFYCSMPLAILTTFIALPALDAINKPVSICLSLLGCFCLSLLFVFWGSEMYQALGKQIQVQKDLSDFRSIARQISFSYPHKRVYLIGLPVSVNQFAESHKMRLSPQRQTQVFNSKEVKRDKALDFVNILTTKDIPLESGENVIYLAWNDDRRTFKPVNHKGRFNFSFIASDTTNPNLTLIPKSTPILSNHSFTKNNFNQPYFETSNSQISFVAGNSPVYLWLPEVELNPSLCKKIAVNASISNAENTKTEEYLKFLWIPESEETQYESPLTKEGNSKYGNQIFNNPDWLGKSYIRKIGIKFEPGSYTANIKKITIGVESKKDSL